MDKILKAMSDYAKSLRLDVPSSTGEVAHVRLDLAEKVESWVALLQDDKLKSDSPKVTGKTGGTTNTESAKS